MGNFSLLHISWKQDTPRPTTYGPGVYRKCNFEILELQQPGGRWLVLRGAWLGFPHKDSGESKTAPLRNFEFTAIFDGLKTLAL